VSGGEREFHNEIHTKHVPSQVWDPERIQFAYQSLLYLFCSEAKVTGADVLSDIPRHLRPPVVPVTNFIWSYLHQFFDDSHGPKASLKPLRRPFDRYQSCLEAINNGQDIRQINW